MIKRGVEECVNFILLMSDEQKDLFNAIHKFLSLYFSYCDLDL